MKFERYHKAVSFLEGLANLRHKHYEQDKRGDKSIYLNRTRYFLQMLGNPDRGMKFIHVTGTAGKGTVSTMFHEVLTASGARAGLFTSPYVTTSIEKIKAGNKYISPDEFADLLEEIKPAINKAYLESPYGGPSYFEIIFAIALLYFKKQKCRWVVLEVAMGGRYDATNVIKKSEAAVITNIDYDHTEILGKTLKRIAWEKAGIIKKGSKFYTTEQRPHLLKIFKSICARQKAKMVHIKSNGDYQTLNKKLVYAVSLDLGFREKDIREGIARAKLPARFEVMPRLSRGVKKNPMVIVDGAHNVRKMETTVNNLQKLSYKKLILILGFSKSKDYIPMLESLMPLANHVIFTRFETPLRKCASPAELLRVAQKSGQTSSPKGGLTGKKRRIKLEISLDPMIALDRAMKSVGKNDLILSTGSFYLAGHIRSRWYPEEYILKNRRSF